MKNVVTNIAIAIPLIATLLALMFISSNRRENLLQERFTEGRAVGEQFGYEAGFKDGDIHGRKQSWAV